jgi:hypothetical protein
MRREILGLAALTTLLCAGAAAAEAASVICRDFKGVSVLSGAQSGNGIATDGVRGPVTFEISNSGAVRDVRYFKASAGADRSARQGGATVTSKWLTVDATVLRVTVVWPETREEFAIAKGADGKINASMSSVRDMGYSRMLVASGTCTSSDKNFLR